MILHRDFITKQIGIVACPWRGIRKPVSHCTNRKESIFALCYALFWYSSLWRTLVFSRNMG